MVLLNKLKRAAFWFGAVLCLCVAASAQQAGSATSANDARRQEQEQEQQQSPGRRMRRGGEFGRGHEMDGMMRMLHGLDLTDAQKQQALAIMERARNSTQSQREELFKLHDRRGQQGALTAEEQARAEQLRQELRASMQQTHAELLALLTPEQRASLEQRRQEFRERRRERRGLEEQQQQKDNQ